METLQINGAVRQSFGKKAAKDARREGLIPCVVYGNGETVSFTVDAKDIKPLIYTPNSYLVELNLDGKVLMSVMREVQYHPLTDTAMHIDFFAITEGKPIAIDIPVRITGNSEGVKQGGKLTLSKRKIRISALMENLPDEIIVDITNMKLGSSTFVGDIQQENVTMLTPATTAICAVKATRATLSRKNEQQ